MEGAPIYLIPKGEDPHDEINDLTWEKPWFLVKRVDRDPDNRIPYELVWKTPDEETSIHYIEDELVQFSYIVVKGSDSQEVADEIRSGMAMYSVDDIFRWLDEARPGGDMMQAVAHLGVAAPRRFDSAFFGRFEQAFASSDPEVRRTAIWSCGYPAWPEFLSILERLSTEDSHPEVREDAGILLASFLQQTTSR